MKIKCNCPCHKEGSNMKHIKACCKDGYIEFPVGPIRKKDPNLKICSFLINTDYNHLDIKSTFRSIDKRAALFSAWQFVFIVDKDDIAVRHLVHELYDKFPKPTIFDSDTKPSIRIIGNTPRTIEDHVDQLVKIVDGDYVCVVDNLDLFEKHHWDVDLDKNKLIKSVPNKLLSLILEGRLTNLKDKIIKAVKPKPKKKKYAKG